jgi:hypothetical protein
MESIIYNIFEIDIYLESLFDIDGKVFGFVKELLLILDKKLIEFILMIREFLWGYMILIYHLGIVGLIMMMEIRMMMRIMIFSFYILSIYLSSSISLYLLF